MAATGATGNLGAVYDSSSADEVARKYDAWAEGYDTEMAQWGYRHPAIALALLARHVPAGVGPILDAGAGTGLVGEWLGIVGYPEADALDISEGMLAVARRKGVYRHLYVAALGKALPFPDATYAAVVCTGVFTTGHVGPEGIDELIRIIRPEGVVVVTAKDTVWPGLQSRIDRLGLRLIEQTPPYHSLPGSGDTVAGRCLVIGR